MNEHDSKQKVSGMSSRWAIATACLLVTMASTDAASCNRGSNSWPYRRDLSLGGQGRLDPHKRRSRELIRNPLVEMISESFASPMYMNSLLRQMQESSTKIQETAPTNPTYSITENAEAGTLELALDVPGVKSEDINVQLEENGTILRVSGSRKQSQLGELVETHFDRLFAMDKGNIDVDQISVKLQDGVLHISAPKVKAPVEKVKRIPISTDVPLKMTEGQDVTIVETAEQKDEDLTITEEDL
eukprot:scaffold18855_cov46-Attheya_sp.AAC.2